MGVTCFLLLSLGLAITVQGQSCSKPVGEPNMSLRDDFILLDSFEDGSKVSFACNVGYMSAGGSPIITCTAGSWSSVKLRCQRKNCGTPGEVEHGNIDYPEGTEFGDKIVITCNEGYKFVGKQGPREIFCGDQGWDDRLPTCEAVACNPPELPPGVTLSPNNEIYTYRDVVRFKCPSGLSLNGSSTASCSDDGTFDSNPPTCVKVQCADIQVQDGEKTQGFKPTYGYQDTVTFKCKDGFKMKGPSTITCDINSQWSPTLPECEVVTCKAPEKVANGTFSPVKDSYNIGDVVQYSCQRDFRLTGPTSVSCLITGTFDSDPPVCTKIQCEDVEIPNGVKVGGSKLTYGYQETMTFKCKDGFKMRGESTVTCDMNSQWSPELPECESVTCKPPKSVANGKFTPVKDSYKIKDNVEYSCDQNYEIVGSKFLTCSPDGTFAPDPPKCSYGDIKDPNGHGNKHVIPLVVSLGVSVLVTLVQHG